LERNIGLAQFCPNLENSPRQCPNSARGCGVSFVGALGIGAQQLCRVMSTPGGDHMHRYTLVKQYRLMTAAKVMEPHLWETELADPSLEVTGDRAAVAELGKVGSIAPWEH
jgi:hypothetical protein